MIRAINLTLFYSALFSVLVSIIFCLPTSAQTRKPTAKVPEAELVSRFKKSLLFDISSDGKLLLLYGVLTPRKGTFGRATEWKPKSGDEMFDMLRVVEWRTGKEIASIHVDKNPNAARFLSDTEVCYRVDTVTHNNTISTQNNLWRYPVNGTSTCSSAPVNKAYGAGVKYESDDGGVVAVTSMEDVRHFLVWSYVRGVVSIEQNSGEKLGVIYHPTVSHIDWPLTGYVYSVGFDSASEHLITSYEGDTYVWRIPR